MFIKGLFIVSGPLAFAPPLKDAPQSERIFEQFLKLDIPENMTKFPLTRLDDGILTSILATNVSALLECVASLKLLIAKGDVNCSKISCEII